jgi:NitT/TauT family transport system permease protein
VLCAAWQGYAVWLGDPLLLPSFSGTLAAGWRDAASGELIGRAVSSIKLLAEGYAVGTVLAGLLTALAVTTRIGDDLLSTLTAILGSLPGIALLPLAIMWFGLGRPSMLFVLAHSVIWPLALNARAGFGAVPETLRLVGRNYGLGRLRLLVLIMAPAAFPAMLSGLRIGWAFAWRTLVGAELVFGINAGSGGLGWYIYLEKNAMETANVFAGLLTIALLGLAMEAVFRLVERRTVARWGMKRALA